MPKENAGIDAGSDEVQAQARGSREKGEIIMAAAKILVVDDEPGIIDLLKTRFEIAGYKVVTAGNGTTALSQVKKEKPDLIVLDMTMPDIQGSTVCAEIKTSRRYQHIPIIILTARTSDYDKDIGKAVKADAYMTKPFRQDELLAKVKELLSKSKK